MKQFATVHCHPSSLDTASTPKAFCEREVELGSPALVCTDHGTLQAAYQIYELAKKAKLTPVVGLEGYFRDDNCPILGKMGIQRTDTVPRGSDREEWLARYPQGTYIDYLKYMHITLHFMDYDAYLCAVRLLSRADDRAEKHGSERKPLFDWSDIEELASHRVTATSSCLVGMVQRHLMQNESGPAARAYFERLHHLFGDRFMVEVFPHVCTHDFVKKVFVEVAGEPGKPNEVIRFNWEKKLGTDGGDVYAEDLPDQFAKGIHHTLNGFHHYRKWTPYDAPKLIVSVRKVEDFVMNECRPWAPDGDVQRGCNRFVMGLAKQHGVPIVIGDDSHFAHPEEKRVQDVRLAQSGPFRFHGSYHRQSSAEAFAYFQQRMGIDQATFEGWVDNSHAWVERFKGFKFDTSPSLPTKFFPTDSLTHTKKLLEHHGRIIRTPQYMGRLKSELDVVQHNGKLKLLPYFQVIEEICRLYNDEGILTGIGRGSAAGLYLTYALGITHADPLKYGLSAERFITPARILQGGLPDIDQDLPNRGLLEGGHVTEVIDFEASDGTKHSVPSSFKVETPAGWLPVGGVDVSGYGLPFKAWWRGQEDDPTATVVACTKERKAYSGWFKERFGDHIIQMSTDTTLKLKAAVRDVARMLHRICQKCGSAAGEGMTCPKCGSPTFGYIPEDVEKWCKSFEEAPMGVDEDHFVLGYQSDDEGWVSGSVDYDPALMAYVSSYPEDWEIVKQALSLTRQKGRHPCGFVLADWPIATRIPLTTVGGVKVTSFTAKSVEKVGGIKMDFLNITILEKIQGALQLIRARHATPEKYVPQTINGRLVPAHRLVPVGDGFCDVWDLPEDQDVFRDVAEGRTETLFQYDTPGVRKWMVHYNVPGREGRIGIGSVEDMSAFTALDRPGGLDVWVANPDWVGGEPTKENGGKHNMLVEYARRARGANPSPDVLPVLEQLCPETHGLMVYQEQWQRVWQHVTGCSPVEAEEMRRNVSKKEKEIIEKAKPGFMERAGAKYGAETAQELWVFLRAWAKYGFNKSHAVCYAITGYVCAYLKHHFPLEWWCSVLTFTPKEKIAEKLWRHCRHLVAMPDVKLSKDGFVIEGDKIRAPISLLHGIGEKAHQQLVQYAPYESVEDFARKIKAHQIATAGPKQRKIKGTEDQYETVTAPGRNALHRGLVHTLIVSGAMASLFPPEFTPADCLSAYDQAMAEVFGKAYTRAKKRVYPALDPIGRYQARKSVLGVYGEDLRVVVKPWCLRPGEENREDYLPYLKLYDGKRMRFAYRKWDRSQRQEVDVEDPVIGGDRLEELVAARTVPLGGWSCGVVAYVQSVKTFKYPKANPENEALKLTLEVDGGTYELVHWPDRKTGKLAAHLKRIGAGDVVAALLERWDQSKEFAIRELRVIRRSLETATEETDEHPAATGTEG